MRNSDRRHWSTADLLVRLVILVLAAFLLMALQLTGRLEALQGAVALITTPGQISVTNFTDRIVEGSNAVREFGRLQQRSAELERINESLLVENLRLQEVERENQRLRDLLAFAETRPSIEFRGGQILARPIGYSSNNFLNFVMLDLGRRHGIAVGMPVVNDQGLIGRISEVNESTSRVLLISDPSSTVNAILQSSRLTGVITGRPGSEPVMGFIPQGSEVAVGEIVITSGMGGNFPKGILIGQVIEVRQRDFDVFQEAVIRPTVDFGRLEVVMVITNFDPLEAIPEFEAMSSERQQIGGASANDADVNNAGASETDDSGSDLEDEDPVVTP